MKVHPRLTVSLYTFASFVLLLDLYDPGPMNEVRNNSQPHPPATIETLSDRATVPTVRAPPRGLTAPFLVLRHSGSDGTTLNSLAASGRSNTPYLPTVTLSGGASPDSSSPNACRNDRDRSSLISLE